MFYLNIFSFSIDNSINSLASRNIFRYNLAINENPGPVSAHAIHCNPTDSAPASIFLVKDNLQDFTIFILSKSTASYSDILMTSYSVHILSLSIKRKLIDSTI